MSEERQSETMVKVAAAAPALQAAPSPQEAGDALLDRLLAESLDTEPRRPLVPDPTPSPRPAGPNGYDPTKSIAKTHYTHKAMIDIILANPVVDQGELARSFGYTEGWISRVLASDAFQQELEQRKSEIVDPLIRASIEERFKALVYRSIDVTLKKLESPTVGADVALEALNISAKALGYGAKPTGPTVNVNSYVALVPPKAASTEEWSKAHGRGEAAIVEVKTASGPT